VAGTPTGFIEADVIAGLHTAMEFGTYIDPATAPIFYLPVAPLSDMTGTTDESGVPYNPNLPMPTQQYTTVQVLCAVEVSDSVPPREGDLEPLGLVNRTALTITLLEAEYRQIEGFAYVKTNDNTYHYAFTRPPIALGPIGVWQVICIATDQR
jgi:hypothetical protein